MGSHESPPDVRAALDAIRRIVRALRLSSTASKKALGVSGAQLFVLEQLAAGGPGSIADLAARTATDPSSVSVVVRRLVAARLAIRHASAEDARRAEVAITPAGRALLRKAPAAVQPRLIRGLAALSTAELRAIASGLGSVAAAMGEAEGAAPMFFENETRPRRRKTREDGRE